MPVSSYAPELLELLIRAGEGQEVPPIRLPSIKAVHRFRFRLNSLRVAMRKEGHPLSSVADRAVFLVQKEPPALVCQQTDTTFADAIRAAGVEVSAPVGVPGTGSPIDEFKPSGGAGGRVTKNKGTS